MLEKSIVVPHKQLLIIKVKVLNYVTYVIYRPSNINFKIISNANKIIDKLFYKFQIICCYIFFHRENIEYFSFLKFKCLALTVHKRNTFLLIYLFIQILITEGWRYPAHFNQNFSGKYPYHKVPDRKHYERQRGLKALLRSR